MVLHDEQPGASHAQGAPWGCSSGSAGGHLLLLRRPGTAAAGRQVAPAIAAIDIKVGRECPPCRLHRGPAHHCGWQSLQQARPKAHKQSLRAAALHRLQADTAEACILAPRQLGSKRRPLVPPSPCCWEQAHRPAASALRAHTPLTCTTSCCPVWQKARRDCRAPPPPPPLAAAAAAATWVHCCRSSRVLMASKGMDTSTEATPAAAPVWGGSKAAVAFRIGNVIQHRCGAPAVACPCCRIPSIGRRAASSQASTHLSAGRRWCWAPSPADLPSAPASPGSSPLVQHPRCHRRCWCWG